MQGNSPPEADAGPIWTLGALTRPVQIDIVVNNYNYAPFLGAAIDSALGQSYPHVRVVVVDDGSTDRSREVIESYGDRVDAVFKDNGGQASAFNAGFAAARGDVVVFLDADDLLDPLIAARVADAVTARPELAKVQWRMELADGDGQPTGTAIPPRHMSLPQGDVRRAELAFPFDLTWAATSGNALPLAVLEQIMPMPEVDYRPCADAYLQHLPPLLGPVASLDEVGVLRRVHGANAYERAPTAGIDVEHVRMTMHRHAVTAVDIERLAGRLGLERPAGPVISVSSTALRLISLRLDPAGHPCRDDRRSLLVMTGIRAARRRSDLHPLMRVAMAAWFVAIALAPRLAARQLGQWFLFPEQRRGANRVIGLLHRGHGERDNSI